MTTDKIANSLTITVFQIFYTTLQQLTRTLQPLTSQIHILHILTKHFTNIFCTAAFGTTT